MPRTCIRRDHDPCAGEVHTPAEAQVVLQQADPLVEATDLGEQVASDQCASARDSEDVAYRVVLFLVELIALDERDAVAALVDALAELQDVAGPVPSHQLRSDHRCVGPVGLLDQNPHGGRVEPHVVVAEEVERGALYDVENLVGGGAEARVRLDAANECRRGDRGDPVLDGNH